MVERSLSMREVPGSIPGASNFIFIFRRNKGYQLKVKDNLSSLKLIFLTLS